MHDHINLMSRQTLEQNNKMPCMLDQKYQAIRGEAPLFGMTDNSLLCYTRFPVGHSILWLQ
jgi:hypothetical protein